MNTKYLTSLVLLVVACSGGQTTGGDGGQTQAQLKKAAADAKASGSAQADACVAHGWYGDGECDRFCQDVDSVDCTPSDGGDPVHCAEFVEIANGFCSRIAEDPCIGQDPDCAGVEPLPTEPPGDPLICPAIAMLPDGVCGAYDANDPCMFYADPDCAAVDPLPPGSGDPGTPDDPGTDPGVPACKVAPEPADGVCSKDANDPCLAADPDCAVGCAAYIELPDGICKRDPNDPCISQDPDCHVK
jgi:hypothetical protein